MERVVYRTCTICDASCGIEVYVEDGKVTAIKGDPLDPLSRGYICPKSAGLAQLYEDPDRLRHPVLRTANGWKEVSWDEALNAAAKGLHAVQRAHGVEASALYSGEPIFHHYSALLMLELFRGVFRGKHFSSATTDEMPRRLSFHWMFGNANFMAIPDIDRTQYLLLLGGNPVVSHGGMMTTPDIKNRLMALRDRGGRLVVVDPRYTESAEMADAHHFIRPGTDALFIAAMLQSLFEEERVNLESLPPYIAGLDTVKEAVAPFTPETVAERVGISANLIRELARDFDDAPSAVAYGHIGNKLVPFAATTNWLLDVLNIVTGNLDRPGGMMFPQQPFDAASLDASPDPGRWKSRISGTPEFMGQLPTATLTAEITTPGPGQVRALITVAGNPVLSAPGGRQMSEALDGLDFMVSLDYYVNETSRHAHVILPPVSPLERDHYELTYHLMAVRNVARWSPAVFPSTGTSQTDGETLVDLAWRLQRRRGMAGWLMSLPLRALRRFGPERTARLIVAAAIRFGARGKGLLPWGKGLTLRAIQDSVHGVDLGPLEPALPQRLPKRRDRSTPRVETATPELIADLKRLHRSLEDETPGLVLIGRRELRSINSWAHNLPKLIAGKSRCVLLLHPEDAAPHALDTGDRVVLKTSVGAIEVPVEITQSIMQGVVCLPHGYGHHRDGARLNVAREHAGVSFNDLTDPSEIDPISGNAVLNAIPVQLEPCR